MSPLAGTNVFTMDLINSHYLGDQKATHDKRSISFDSHLSSC